MNGSAAEARISYQSVSDSTCFLWDVASSEKLWQTLIFVTQVCSDGPEITEGGGLLKTIVITIAVIEQMFEKLVACLGSGGDG